MSRVGRDIDAVCSKCKMLLNHVVVSEVNGYVSKVQCRTCGSLHKFRGGEKKPAPPKKERTTRLVKAASSAAGYSRPKETHRLWQMKKDTMPSDADITDYRMDGEYGPSDIIRHSTFGVGFVERIVNKTRVEILFQAGLKLMAMNSSAS